MKKIAIIGGGAAGLAAAVFAGRVVCAMKASASARASDNETDDLEDRAIRITIYEVSDRIGRPILASGNGRCNFSNAHIDPAEYRNGDFAAEALAAFEELMARSGFSHRTGVSYEPDVSRRTGVSHGSDVSCGSDVSHGSDVSRETISDYGNGGRTAPALCYVPNGVVRFFEDLGMFWREEAEGRLYPKANKASVVLDVLRAAVCAAGTEVRTGICVNRVELPRNANGRSGARFALHMADGSIERADAVIVACGGAVAKNILPDSFDFEPQRPVLGPIATDTRWVKQLDNIRVKCAVELLRAADDDESGMCEGDQDMRTVSRETGSHETGPCEKGPHETIPRETGEVLFRKYGVSGIAIFNLSRLAQPGDALIIDLFPDIELSRLKTLFVRRLQMLKANFDDCPSRKDFLRGAVLPQVAHVLLAYAGLEEDVPCSKADARKIAHICKRFRLEYNGIGDEEQCQVHRGGFVPREGFDAETMQAKRAPGLFVVGEALDIDGPCGGYNLHWAFASGALAGANAASMLASSLSETADSSSDEKAHGVCA